MHLPRRSFLLALAATCFALPAQAGPETYAAARQFVQTKHGQLHTRLKTSADPKSDPQLLEILDTMLDYDHFVKGSLGQHWESLNPAQRTRFQDVLRGLIRGSYRRNLRDISGYEVKYTGESDGQDGVLVATLASDPQKRRREPLRIDYVVAKYGSGHRIRDIVTGGVSLLQNYRKQFGRILKKDGFDALVARMEAQLQKLDGAGGSEG